MRAGLCGGRGDDGGEEAEGRGGDGGGVDADAVGGGRARDVVDGVLEEAVVAFAEEGVEGVEGGEEGEGVRYEACL